MPVLSLSVSKRSPTLQWRQDERDGVSNHQPHHCLLNRLSRRRSKNIKAPRHWPLSGNSPATGEFSAQRASNAENASIWWRHRASLYLDPNCHIKKRHVITFYSNTFEILIYFFSREYQRYFCHFDPGKRKQILLLKFWYFFSREYQRYRCHFDPGKRKQIFVEQLWVYNSSGHAKVWSLLVIEWYLMYWRWMARGFSSTGLVISTDTPFNSANTLMYQVVSKSLLEWYQNNTPGIFYT